MKKINFKMFFLKLKAEYKIFKELEIKQVLLNGNNLMRKEKMEAQIKDLQIKETDIILNIAGN